MFAAGVITVWSIIVNKHTYGDVTWLIGRQEGHLACKKSAVVSWT